MPDTSKSHTFLAVARGLLAPMEAICATLDYSVDAYAPDFVLIRLDETYFNQFRFNVLYPACVETGLSPIAMLIRVMIPSEGSSEAVIAEGSNYNEFCHRYVWEELKRRNAAEEMNQALAVGQMLQSLVSALMDNSDVDSEEEDDEPCSDPNCEVCRPKTDVSLDGTASKDSFFIDTSKTVH